MVVSDRNRPGIADDALKGELRSRHNGNRKETLAVASHVQAFWVKFWMESRVEKQSLRFSFWDSVMYHFRSKHYRRSPSGEHDLFTFSEHQDAVLSYRSIIHLGYESKCFQNILKKFFEKQNFIRVDSRNNLISSAQSAERRSSRCSRG